MRIFLFLAMNNIWEWEMDHFVKKWGGGGILVLLAKGTGQLIFDENMK